MNKYLKALDYLAENSMYETVERSDLPDGVIWKEITHEGIEAQELLQELIDRAVPKKVKVWSFVNAKGKYIDVYYCGSCNQSIDRIKYENHCFNCGQALDWRK